MDGSSLPPPQKTISRHWNGNEVFGGLTFEELSGRPSRRGFTSCLLGTNAEAVQHSEHNVHQKVPHSRNCNRVPSRMLNRVLPLSILKRSTLQWSTLVEWRTNLGMSRVVPKSRTAVVF